MPPGRLGQYLGVSTDLEQDLHIHTASIKNTRYHGSLNLLRWAFIDAIHSPAYTSHRMPWRAARQRTGSTCETPGVQMYVSFEDSLISHMGCGLRPWHACLPVDLLVPMLLPAHCERPSATWIISPLLMPPSPALLAGRLMSGCPSCLSTESMKRCSFNASVAGFTQRQRQHFHQANRIQLWKFLK